MRGILVDVLNEVIPEVVELMLKVNDLAHGKAPGEYDVSVQFGEYAAPDFASTVEVVGKAVTYGIMSKRKAIDEMYGDTITDEEKEEELKEIAKDNGSTEIEEPLINNGDDLDE